MRRILTNFHGHPYEIRPMTAEDIRWAHRHADGTPRQWPDDETPPWEILFDPRWHVCRWLGEDQTEAPGYDCPAWVDRGRVFLPNDGTNATLDFYHEGPKAGEGRIWHEAGTGRPAVWRTSAPLWVNHTGPLQPGHYLEEEGNDEA